MPIPGFWHPAGVGPGALPVTTLSFQNPYSRERAFYSPAAVSCFLDPSAMGEGLFYCRQCPPFTLPQEVRPVEDPVWVPLEQWKERCSPALKVVIPVFKSQLFS